jgi:uncharacterized protein YndB with AHSA1/START domain
MEINGNAPIIARHEISIRAPLETVWQLQTRVACWPEWNPDIVTTELIGPLEVGSEFHWETTEWAISSTLDEIVPLKRLAWSGKSGNVVGIHVWTFSPNAEGTSVRTEESWEGASLPAQTTHIQRALDDSLVRWLSYLKTRAEAAGLQGAVAPTS